MSNDKSTLAFALEKYPEQVELVPLEALVLDSTRGNDKRPATLKIAVPDEMVKALRGPRERRPNLVFLVTMPRQVAERAESPIILPNEVR